MLDFLDLAAPDGRWRKQAWSFRMSLEHANVDGNGIEVKVFFSSQTACPGLEDSSYLQQFGGI
jgi:hypothetical protein